MNLSGRERERELTTRHRSTKRLLFLIDWLSTTNVSLSSSSFEGMGDVIVDLFSRQLLGPRQCSFIFRVATVCGSIVDLDAQVTSG